MGFTEENVPPLRDRTYLITGANGGLGYETTRAIVEHGGLAIMACRNTDSMREAANTIRQLVPGAQIDEVELDLSSLASVRNAAETIRSRHPQINVIINNAGVMDIPFRLTEDGYETQFQVNHLGHFMLDGLLIDTLQDADDSRVVTVSSGRHVLTKGFKVDELANPPNYDEHAAYSYSKFANILYAKELARRAKESDSPVKSMSAHPGGAKTKIMYADKEEGGPVANFINQFAQPADRGAWPTLRAATEPEAQSGDNYGPMFGVWGSAVRQPTSPKSYDPALGAELWKESEQLTGFEFHL